MARHDNLKLLKAKMSVHGGHRRGAGLVLKASTRRKGHGRKREKGKETQGLPGLVRASVHESRPLLVVDHSPETRRNH